MQRDCWTSHLMKAFPVRFRHPLHRATTVDVVEPDHSALFCFIGLQAAPHPEWSRRWALPMHRQCLHDNCSMHGEWRSSSCGALPGKPCDPPGVALVLTTEVTAARMSLSVCGSPGTRTASDTDLLGSVKLYMINRNRAKSERMSSLLTRAARGSNRNRQCFKPRNLSIPVMASTLAVLATQTAAPMATMTLCQQRRLPLPRRALNPLARNSQVTVHSRDSCSAAWIPYVSVERRMTSGPNTSR